MTYIEKTKHSIIKILTENIVNEETVMDVKLNLFLMKAKIY